jgi:hypothetical protein
LALSGAAQERLLLLTDYLLNLICDDAESIVDFSGQDIPDWRRLLPIARYMTLSHSSKSAD